MGTTGEIACFKKKRVRGVRCARRRADQPHGAFKRSCWLLLHGIKLKGARVSVEKRVESSERNLQEEARGAMLAMPAQDVNFIWEGPKVPASVGRRGRQEQRAHLCFTVKGHFPGAALTDWWPCPQRFT